VATLIGAGSLTFREFVMREPLPLATVHDAVLEFVRGRQDAVLLGALAVNAYVDEPRMTQDVDLASTRAAELAGEIRAFLMERLGIAVRVRRIQEGRAYRLYQVRKEGNRHLVDVRSVTHLPPSRRIEGFLVVAPEEAIAGKVAAWVARHNRPKAGTDWRDLAMLLLRFPELKSATGPVRDRLIARNAGEPVLRAWQELVAQEIRPEGEEEEFDE
jgi:hypothetical protein